MVYLKGNKLKDLKDKVYEVLCFDNYLNIEDPRMLLLDIVRHVGSILFRRPKQNNKSFQLTTRVFEIDQLYCYTLV